MTLEYTIDINDTVRLYQDGRRIPLKAITRQRKAKHKTGEEDVLDLIPRVDYTIDSDIYTTKKGAGNTLYINRCCASKKNKTKNKTKNNNCTDDYYVWITPPTLNNQNMSSWTVYTKPNCQYCERTKHLLSGENVTYIDLNKKELPYLRQKYSIPPDHNTVPIIIKDNTFVGGYDDMILRYNNINNK